MAGARGETGGGQHDNMTMEVVFALSLAVRFLPMLRLWPLFPLRLDTKDARPVR
jgi:hypothetical protein